MKIRTVFILVFVVSFAVLTVTSRAQDKEPTDEQLAIQFLKAQVEWQARVIQNLQKQLKECTPQK